MTAAAKHAASAIAEALAPGKINAFVEAVGFVEPVGFLLPIPRPLPAEVDDAPEPCDDWADALLYAAALVHVRASSFRCLGYTMCSSGRARCGRCSWSMSARMGDVGTFMSARFALAALARIGQAVALAVDVVVQALFEAVLPC